MNSDGLPRSSKLENKIFENIKKAFRKIFNVENGHLVLRSICVAAICTFYVVTFLIIKSVWLVSFTAKLIKSLVSFLIGKLGMFFIPSTIVAAVSMWYLFQFFNTFVVGLNVYLDGEKVACVTSEDNFENMVAAFENRLAYELGENYKMDLDVMYEFTFVKYEELHDDVTLEEKLLSRVSEDIHEMAVLTVDGYIIGANVDEKALRDMVESVKSQYLEGYLDESADFARDVEITTRLLRGVENTSIQEMEAYLTQPLQEAVKYFVSSGDTVWSIAPRYNMSPSELLEMNPGLGDGSKLSIGQEITVSSEVPRVSINTYRVVEYEDTIPFEVSFEYDANMYKNQKKIKLAGVKGTRWVKAEITLTNGIETDRAIIAQTVLSNPITQVEIVGTKALPATAPTGTFARPTSGTITARFGTSGRRWSSGRHTGIDIANARGTAIYAADGGTVSYAGWKSSYGNCIIIDHGNGRQTLYGHLSGISVSKGQSVAKGARIGSMGSSGNASGVHLHFEIIINGTQRNPENYVNF